MNHLTLPSQHASKKELVQHGKSIALATEDPHGTFIAAKRIEALAKSVSDALSDEVLNSIDEEPLEIDGATIGVSRRTTWDYSHSPVWVELSTALKQYEALMRQAHEQPGFTTLDDNGEIVPAAKIKSISVSPKTTF